MQLFYICIVIWLFISFIAILVKKLLHIIPGIIVSCTGLLICYYQYGQNSEMDTGARVYFEGLGTILIGSFIIFIGFVLSFVGIFYEDKWVSNIKIVIVGSWGNLFKIKWGVIVQYNS